jgi:hypothetical protein
MKSNQDSWLLQSCLYSWKSCPLVRDYDWRSEKAKLGSRILETLDLRQCQFRVRSKGCRWPGYEVSVDRVWTYVQISPDRSSRWSIGVPLCSVVVMAESNLVDDMKFQDFARERSEASFGSLSSTQSLHNSLLKMVSSSFRFWFKSDDIQYEISRTILKSRE